MSTEIEFGPLPPRKGRYATYDFIFRGNDSAERRRLRRLGAVPGPRFADKNGGAVSASSRPLVELIDDILAQAKEIDPGFEATRRSLLVPENRSDYQAHFIAYGLRWACQLLGWDTDDPPWCERPSTVDYVPVQGLEKP
jgi:hypothetical protein